MPSYIQQQNQQSESETSGNSNEVSPQGLVGNQAMIDVIRAQNRPTGQRDVNPNKNGIVYLGMNLYSHDESNALNRMNRGNGGARSVRPLAEQDKITQGGVQFDLHSETDVASFISTLGMTDSMALKASEFLFRGGDEARDELAQFIRILSEAEMGERTIDRMVLSGHSVGSMIWGDENGLINMDEFAELADIFPKAMGQVKHLMLSSCYSGGETRMQDTREIWQGVESIWAYHDSSPGSWTGAMDHMKEWENVTRTGDASMVDPELAKGHRKSKNVSTWNTTDGYQGGKPMNPHEIRTQLSTQENMYQEFFNGTQLVENSQTGPLREYYALVQRGISHPEIDEGYRAELEVRRDITIRLLYYSLICKRFQEHHHSQLDDAYRASSTELPDYSAWNRAEMLGHISEMQGHLDEATMSLLQRGLGELNPEVIPTTWV